MTHILVIDDDPYVQVLLERTLSRQGYEVSLAEDGEVGLELAIALKPALILCDWIMPELDGLEVCRRVKALPSLSTTLFLLLTARDSVDDKIQGLDAGADDFLCKPLEMSELQAKIRAALRIHQLSQDLQNQKHQLETELNEAAIYVQSILPPALRHPAVSIDLSFIPSQQLGGDGFDYFWLDEEHLAFYLLDVSGHGLKAALPSISVLNLMRSHNIGQRMDYYQPSVVLKSLNIAFNLMERHEQYFTIWYGVYDTGDRVLTYASAGHPAAILFLANFEEPTDVQFLKTRGFPIGMFTDEEVKYTEESCYIPFQSRLYLFSDGVYENPKNLDHKQGFQNFINLLSLHQCYPEKSLQTFLKQVQSDLHSNGLEDDFSLMEISFY